MIFNKKNRIIFVSILLIVVISCLFLIKKPNKNTFVRDFPEIKKSGELNIVTEYNSVDYYVYEDTIKGRQYKLAKYIEKQSGLKVNIFLENNMGSCISKLANNEYDIIARNIPITTEIKERLTFTEPIDKSEQVLVQRNKNNDDSTVFISNQIELANQTVYLPEDSPAILRIKNLSEEIAEPIYIEEDKRYSAEHLLYMVAFKEIDYAVVDKSIALKNIEQFPDLNISTNITFTQLQAWGIRKNAPILLDSLNVWINEYNKNKNVSKITRSSQLKLNLGK